VRQLERHFAQDLGCAPRQWLEARRLDKAAQLLHAGKSVKETAWELDYKHPSHFIRRFKRRFGCTPGVFVAYREDYQI
jgi:AraC-like DNA-binding protein